MPLTGRSVAEAIALLKTHDANTLRASKSRSLAEVPISKLREPMYIRLAYRPTPRDESWWEDSTNLEQSNACLP